MRLASHNIAGMLDPRQRALLMAGAALITFPALAGAQTLSIATGNPSGVYYPLGGGLASIWSRVLSDVNIKAEVTAGSVTNLIQVAKLESEAGLAQGDATAAAVAGTGRFPYALPVATLGRLYPNVVHLVTLQDSGIVSLGDIKGRKVSVGPLGSGNAVTAWNVLAALGVSEEDFRVRQLNYTETSNGLKDGTIDAGFITGGLGIAAVAELAVARRIRLVHFGQDELQKITERVPAYSAFQVPPGTYRGVSEPVVTPSVWNYLVVNQTMGEDLAYRLLETLFAHRDELVKISSVARQISQESAYRVGPIPLHPGAARYYKDVLGATIIAGSGP